MIAAWESRGSMMLAWESLGFGFPNHIDNRPVDYGLRIPKILI